MEHNRKPVGSSSLRTAGIISVIVIISGIGLALITLRADAGENGRPRPQWTGISSIVPISDLTADAIRHVNEAGVSRSEIRRKTFERLREAAAKSEGGMTHAIVGVDAEFTPVGYLTGLQAERQTKGIEKAQADVVARVTSGRIEVVHQYEFMPFVLVAVDETALTHLQNDSEVLTIEEDTLAESHLAQSTSVVNAPAAWTAGFDGTGWEVAVLDTGVNKHHDFFGVGPPTKVVSEACYSNGDGGAGASSLCPGGATSSTAPDSGLNCTGFSGCEHGTHAAGIAAGNNGTNASGIGRGANIIAIQVFRAFTAAACGGQEACTKSATSDQIRALERVLFLTTPAGGSRRIAAVNMSLGGLPHYFSNPDCDAANASRKAAIDNLRSVGVATVVSSGNDGNRMAITAPACISSAISVGSTVDNGIDLDGVSRFSNSFPDLSLLAPGETITSATGFGNPSNVFGDLSGTSFAAPHVAGAFAVLKQAAPNLPNATSVGTILNALRTTGRPVQDFRNGVTTPRINVDAARRVLQGLPTPTPTPVPTPSPMPPVVTCAVTGVLGTAPAGGTTGNLEGRPPRLLDPTACNPETSFPPFGSPGPYIYNAHRFANTSASAVCVTVTLIANVAGTAPTDLQATAQVAPFVPSENGNRVLGQSGLTTGSPAVARSFMANVPANASFDVVVNSANVSPAGQGAQYTLNVSGLPSCPAGVPAVTPTPTPTPTPDPFQISAVLIQDASGEEGGSPGATEGATTIDFPITLSAPSSQIVTVQVSTNGITATEEGDFVGVEEIEVVFPPNTMTRTISITTIEDPGDEPDESFSLDIMSVSNATVGDGQGIGTIFDDDGAPAGMEGDLAPRPSGDGIFRSNDLAALQLFFAGTPVTPGSNEFQRADGAPYETRGDGRLAASDVQLMRNYVAQLAIPQSAGGPAQPVALPPYGPEIQGESNGRVLRAVGSAAKPGESATVAIEMDGRGGETIASFTMRFDPSILSDPKVRLGNGVSARTTLVTNMTRVSEGEIGVLIDSDGGFEMSRGEMLAITFDVGTDAPLGAAAIRFSSSLVAIDVSDRRAKSLKTEYQDGEVLIGASDSTASSDQERVNLRAVAARSFLGLFDLFY